MKILEYKDDRVRVQAVKELIQSAGNQIGSIYFRKRSDGSRRRISYRIHVRKPTYAKAPSGKNISYRKAQDSNHGLITVFDTNMIRRNNQGKMCGRGGYKSIPLNGVYRVKVNGEVYRIVS